MSAEAVQSSFTSFKETEEEPPRFIHLKVWNIPEIHCRVPYLAVRDGVNYLPLVIPGTEEPPQKSDKNFWSFRNFLPRSIAAQYYMAQQAGIPGADVRKSVESGAVSRKLMKYLRSRMNLKGTELTWNAREFPKKTRPKNRRR
ncbi:MAG TPA: hypothetical protein O0X25_04345 [Methanocorpusculum sp.]|nr:hypothetical protein [Methanocorpusculum sp.]HJJ40458.1 hypothetical protein [Methanocorpusculum sp.]HJJ49828.1 hypothetical protein [Methanocorpusculum sp.]